MSNSHDHDHGIANAPQRALVWAFGLTSLLLVAEAVGGWLTNSLALLSDAAHMLTDAAALAIALAAIRFGAKVADQKRTFGYARFEILAATFNAGALLVVAAYILWEAVDRFKNPPEIQSGAVMALAVVGLVVNLIYMRILRGHSEGSLNVKGAYLEVWSDMLGSVGVLLAGAVVWLTGWKPIDPIIAVLIGLWVVPRTWVMLSDSLNILLEGVPRGIDMPEVEKTITAVPGVHRVHDLHVWAVTSQQLLLTAHVELEEALEDSAAADAQGVLCAIQKAVAETHHITHLTIQLEKHGMPRPDCHFVRHAPGAAEHSH